MLIIDQFVPTFGTLHDGHVGNFDPFHDGLLVGNDGSFSHDCGCVCILCGEGLERNHGTHQAQSQQQ